MKFIILLLGTLALTASILQAQTIGGVENIDDDKVSEWHVSKKSEYQGVYKLGYSEWESFLVIIVTDDHIVAQIKRGQWSKASNPLDWVMTYQTLNDVRIEGSLFYSKEFNGQFSIYDDGKNKQKGFKRLETSDLHKKYEFGDWYGELDSYFSGIYPQVSMRLLGKSELDTLTKEELQLARNEIFARYGYRFIQGGKMDSHFKVQSWYKGYHKDINSWVTLIERANIELIKQLEAKK